MKDTPGDSRAPEAADLATLRVALLRHYDEHARDLPWRRDTDPYRVLVSEVMLQQTRVETVTGYYDPWLERFPTLDALATAGEDEVLKAWEGLGYYRRARNLHRAARTVREELGGALPTEYEALRALPGIGEYTAGAIASIAFDEPVPAVDGNVKRVLARLHDVAEPKPKWLRARAAELVDPARPGDWNQALMELGATVCTPRAPRCEGCPWTEACAARAAGTQLERPARSRKRPVPSVSLALAVIHAQGRVLLARRPEDGLLGGMWAFPEAEIAEEEIPEAETARGQLTGADAPGRAQIGRLASSLGLVPVGRPEALPVVRHRFTHLDARYYPWTIEVAPGAVGGTPSLDPAIVAWVDPATPGDRALPRAQTRVLEAWLRSRNESSQATGTEER